MGGPNSGKSALVEMATNARAEVTDFLSAPAPGPGMFALGTSQFQLVDLPPVAGTSRGPGHRHHPQRGRRPRLVDASDPNSPPGWTRRRRCSPKKIELGGLTGLPSAPATIRARVADPGAARQERCPTSPGGRLAGLGAVAPPGATDPAPCALADPISAHWAGPVRANRLHRGFSKRPGKEAGPDQALCDPHG